MVLHHSGKDAAKGMRGSSSLLGAVDTELELLRFEEQLKDASASANRKTASKMRDSALRWLR
jgi:hypothetical protein